MNPVLLSSAIISIAVLSAQALDVSGTVYDKVFRPVPGALVCLQANPGTCVTSGADGAFHFRGAATALASWRETGPVHGVRRGLPAWDGPRGEAPAWFSGDGRKLGRGRLQSLSWKAAGPGRAPGAAVSTEAAASFRSALAKAAAPSALSVSKAGFAETVYQPVLETETGVLIVLGGAGEKVSLLFNGKNLDGWLPSSGRTIGGAAAAGSWTVKDGALHSEGTVRGVLVPKEDYADFRLIFTVRHLKTDAGKADHYPCFLFWGHPRDALPNDALGALQFEPPTPLVWDYRPGKPGAGGTAFTKLGAKFDEYKWTQCEVFADAAASQARMACCDATAGPCGGARELVRWKEAGWAKKSPWGFQVHNTGLHDEYRNITIEVDPAVRDLITTR